MSKNNRSSQARLIVLLISLSVLLISLSIFVKLNIGLGERPLLNTDSPQAIVERAWEMADDSGVYNFNTQLEQTTYPAPSLANVGSTSQTDHFALDGKIDRPDEIMDLTLYPNSNRNGTAGLRVRIDGDEAYTLTSTGK